MNKTSTLEIIQNLRQEGLDLANLNENQIIRIEKSLKAKIKLDQSLDINELEAVIHLLRTQSDHLELFLNEDFRPVRMILQNKDYVFFSADSLNKVKAEEEKLKPFLKDFFFDELTSYARRCIDDNHYRALFDFLGIRSLLDEEILNTIRKQMEQRFLLLTETFRLHANKKPDKVFPLMNPFFYRCINLLNRDAVFEDKVMNFQYLIISEENKVSSSVFIRLIFSITYYLPIGERNKEITQQNHTFSISRGGFVPHEKYKNTSFRGGSACKNSRKIIFKATPSNTTRYILAMVIAALLIVLYFYKPTNHHSKRLPRIENYSQSMQNYKPTNSNRKSFGYGRINNLYKDYLPDAATIQYLQFDSPEIIEEIPLNLKRKYFFNNSSLKTFNNSGFLQLTNFTRNYIILILQNKMKDSTFLLLSPLENMNVSFDLTNLTVYTGKELEEVVYLDKNDSKKYGMRFNKFDKHDKEAFKKNYTFKGINKDKSHSIQIFTKSDNDTGIGVKYRVVKP